MAQESITRHPQDLVDRLWKWKEQGKFCDATFSVNGLSIPIHLAVVASYSEYFEKTFENTNDFPKDTTFVLDVDVNVVESLIEYCYKGNFDVNEKNALDTFLTASILGISPVVKNSITVLKKMLNFENCLSIWKVAKLIENDLLINHIVPFIKEYIGKVSQSDEFLSLEYSDVLQVFSSTATVRFEIDLYLALKKWINFDRSRTKHLNELLQFVKLECLAKDSFLSEAQSICGMDSVCLLKFVTASLKRNENSIDCLSNTLVVLGGEFSDQSRVVEIFDLNTKKWVQYSYVDCEKSRFAAVLIEDKIMIIGGYNITSLKTVEYYNLRTGGTESLAQMKYARYYMPAVNYKNTVYVFGGNDENDKNISSVEKWSPSARTWQEVAPMTVPRRGAGAAILDDEIFVVGGYDGSNFLSVTEAYNPTTNTWRRCKDLNERRRHLGLATVKGILYAVGGNNPTNLRTAEKYEKTNDIWTMIQSTDVTKYGVAAGNLNGQLVITGGTDIQNLVEAYDEKNNKWTTISPLNKSRYMHKVVEVPWSLAELALARKS